MLLIAVGCKKEDSISSYNNGTNAEHPAPESVKSCSESTNWTHRNMKTAVVGSWKLIKVYPSGNQAAYAQDINLQINSNGELTLISGGQIDRKSGYEVTVLYFQAQNQTKEQYSLATENNPFATGELSICDNYMLLSNRHVGGNDYFYQKMQ